jgi:lipid-A-disaccharide synthase
VEKRVERFFSRSDIPVRVVTGRENRYDAFRVSRIALAKSGTVSLELAAVGVPHLIAYRFNALTDFLVRRVIRIRYANLLNLLADREIIPEFVLHNCRPGPIAACALDLLEHSERGRAQVAAARQSLNRLRLPDILPSDRAAQIVLEAARSTFPEVK